MRSNVLFLTYDAFDVITGGRRPSEIFFALRTEIAKTELCDLLQPTFEVTIDGDLKVLSMIPGNGDSTRLFLKSHVPPFPF